MTSGGGRPRQSDRRQPLPWIIGIVLAALPVALSAQTLPLPVVPTPEPSPGSEVSAGQPTVVQEPASPRSWEYAAGIGVRWDSNVTFLVPDGPSALAVVPRGALSRVFRSPRAQWRAQVAGRYVGYADQALESRGYLDLDLDGTYRWSPSTTGRASVSYGLGHSDASQPLTDQGVLLPLVQTRTLVGTVGLSRRLGTRASLRIDGRIYRTDFDSPELQDGESARATTGLDLRLGSRHTAALVYSLEEVLAGSPAGSYVLHFGSFQWTRLLSSRSALLAELGASYAPDAVRANLERKENFFGGVSLTRQVRRAVLVAFVRREVAPAFGTGRSRLDVRVGLNAALPVGRGFALRLAALRVRPDNPSDSPPVEASTDEASLSLVRRLGGRLELSGDALYRRRGATSSLPSIQAYQVGLSLTLLGPGPRSSLPASTR